MVEIRKDYFITEDGTIYSKKKFKTLTKMKPNFNNTGYLYQILSVDGKRVGYRVHRLVAEAYIPNPDNKPCVNHIDGNKYNNHVSNLEWCTHSENNIHAFKTGLSCISDKNKEASKKLRHISFEDAEEIRKRYKARDRFNGLRPLAREFGIDKQGIRKILNRETYKEK